MVITKLQNITKLSITKPKHEWLDVVDCGDLDLIPRMPKVFNYNLTNLFQEMKYYLK